MRRARRYLKGDVNNGFDITRILGLMNVRGPLGPILLSSDFAFVINRYRAARLVLRELKGSLI